MPLIRASRWDCGATPAFHDDDKVREYLESIRWPDGSVCPHCGSLGDHYRLEGKGHRKGLLKCCEAACPMQFSVTVAAVFERSKIPLPKCPSGWPTA